MLKTNSEAFKKEATAASEKSRNLQVANSKIQATLDSTMQVIDKYFCQKNNSLFKISNPNNECDLRTTVA